MSLLGLHTIHSRSDLRHAWQLLLEPFDCSRPTLWVMLVATDGDTHGSLMQVSLGNRPPDEWTVQRLGDFLTLACSRIDGDWTIAALLAHPGPSDDVREQTWAAAVYAACAAGGLGCHAVHASSPDRLTAYGVADVAGVQIA